ncbi:MAG: recombinase family protein [Candidatus Omnitrophica bacterium]|nr:recombinase family protein [Candidatus Omnitrophota bacterium]
MKTTTKRRKTNHKSKRSGYGKVVFYGRSAVAEQGKGNASCETQVAQANEWLRIRNLPELQKENIFFDAPASGMVSDRSELKRLRLEVEGGNVSTILIAGFDRLSRGSKFGMEIIREFESHGVNLCFVKEQMDTTTATGKMVFKMMISIIQLMQECEKAARKERMMKGRVRRSMRTAYDRDKLVAARNRQHMAAKAR